MLTARPGEMFATAPDFCLAGMFARSISSNTQKKE